MTLLVSLHADVGEIPKYAIHHQAPPPDAWISTFGVDAPFSGASYSEYQRVDDSAARTEHRKRLRGRRTAGGLDEKGMRARALSRKAGSVSAKAERPQNAKNIHGVTSQWPRAARASLVSRLPTSVSGCGSHSCGGGVGRGMGETNA